MKCCSVLTSTCSTPRCRRRTNLWLPISYKAECYSNLDVWSFTSFFYHHYIDKNFPKITAILSFPAKNLHNVHLMFFCTKTKRSNARDPVRLPCYSTRMLRQDIQSPAPFLKSEGRGYKARAPCRRQHATRTRTFSGVGAWGAYYTRNCRAIAL